MPALRKVAGRLSRGCLRKARARTVPTIGSCSTLATEHQPRPPLGSRRLRERRINTLPASFRAQVHRPVQNPPPPSPSSKRSPQQPDTGRPGTATTTPTHGARVPRSLPANDHHGRRRHRQQSATASTGPTSRPSQTAPPTRNPKHSHHAASCTIRANPLSLRAR